MKKDLITVTLVLLLAIAGLSAAGYLATKQIQGIEITNCPIFESGCGEVLNSKYSEFLGIPLSYYGVIYYSGMIIFAGLFFAFRKKVIKDLMGLGAIIGFIDSLIFIYIQAVLIGSFCFYCVSSAITATLIFFVMLPTIINKLLDWFE